MTTHTADCFLCHPPKTRCQARMLRRRLVVGALKLSLETAQEMEDIYWEQTKKLSGEVKTEFKKYARRFTKERKQIEKALRSRGVSL